MRTQFSMDLRLARRKAGYTQADIAHLLSSHQSVVSDLEHGRAGPTLIQIVELSLIYGRSFEAFFEDLVTQRRQELADRLERLPTLRRHTAHTFNRAGSLERLKRRLEQSVAHGGD